MDEDGPFPTNKLRNSDVLVVTEHFNEWPEVYTIPDQEPESVANAFLNRWVTRFGAPMDLSSDKKWNLESALSQRMIRNWVFGKRMELTPRREGRLRKLTPAAMGT